MQKLLYWYWLMILMGTVKTNIKNLWMQFSQWCGTVYFLFNVQGECNIFIFLSHTKLKYNCLVEEEQQCELYEPGHRATRCVLLEREWFICWIASLSFPSDRNGMVYCMLRLRSSNLFVCDFFFLYFIQLYFFSLDLTIS